MLQRLRAHFSILPERKVTENAETQMEPAQTSKIKKNRALHQKVRKSYVQMAQLG